MNAFARYLFGVAAIGFGACALVWHSFPNWELIKSLGDATYQVVLTDIVGAVAVIGGVAVFSDRTERAGALILCALFAAVALLGFPYIIKQPLVYNGYGNFFEQLSLAAGAAMIVGDARLQKIAYYAFGLCVMSFALEQAFYLNATASFVPKWIPFGQMFWAVATTVAFVAASIALLTGIRAQLASRLNTAMLVVFGIAVWFPALFANAHSFVNWSETIETFGIVGSAGLVTAYLDAKLHFTRA